MKNHLIKYIMYSLIAFIILYALIGSLSYLKNKEDEINTRNNAEVITYNVTFSLNGADKIDKMRLSCMYDMNNNCIVHLPKAYRNDGKVLGYSLNFDSKTADYMMDSDLTLTENITLYVISYKVNTLFIDDSNVDYLSDNDISCVTYNKQKECSVQIPEYNKIGYEVKGYSTMNTSLTGFIYPDEDYLISKNTTIYPIYSTSNRTKIIDISKTLKVNDSFVEIENGCSSDISDTYIEYLNEIKDMAPYLLFGNKISFLTDSTFDEIWGRNYVGMNYGPRKLRSFDIRCSETILNDYYGTMVHELSHTWDYYYSTKLGKNITSNSDIINLYNKYRKLRERPFRDYSYTSIYEFFADMERYYYFKYVKPTYEYSKLGFPEDIKTVLEKYICISRNDYNEEKCR